VTKVIPDSPVAIRTRPLEALIIGAYVRGLPDRDVESLVPEAGLSTVSKSMVSRICTGTAPAAAGPVSCRSTRR
jgi:transposase-like protein